MSFVSVLWACSKYIFTIDRHFEHVDLGFICSNEFCLDLCGNWIEIAYGTTSGAVRVIVQHPETVGHGPQLFQTFTVHQSKVIKVRYKVRGYEK